MVTHDYEEKRDFLRMKVDTRITYSKKNDNTIHYGNSIDLSAAGLCMTTNTPLQINDELEIVMNPSSEKLPPFTAEGTVVRCDADTTDKTLFNVSVKLITS